MSGGNAVAERDGSARRALARNIRLAEPDKIRTEASPAPIPASHHPDHPAPADPGIEANGDVEPAVEDPDDTVGTGSAIALGCIAATLLVIVIGLIFLAIVALID